MEDKISILIDRYLDGLTSNVEEKELRDYFRSHADVPEEWQSLRPLFLFVDAERAALQTNAEVSTSETVTPVEPKAPTAKLHPPTRRIWLAWASAAAAILLFVAVPFIRGKDDKNFAIINGERTTNQEIVMQEAEDALEMVAIEDDDAFSALSVMANDAE